MYEFNSRTNENKNLLIKIELISSLRSVALQRIPFTVKATRYDDTSDIERIST